MSLKLLNTIWLTQNLRWFQMTVIWTHMEPLRSIWHGLIVLDHSLIHETRILKCFTADHWLMCITAIGWKGIKSLFIILAMILLLAKLAVRKRYRWSTFHREFIFLNASVLSALGLLQLIWWPDELVYLNFRLNLWVEAHLFWGRQWSASRAIKKLKLREIL